MPFHTACFDIFSRLSRQRFGRVNLNYLMEWWGLGGSEEDFEKRNNHEDVKKGQEQCWDHSPGAEYLAANPLYVPGLPSILHTAIRDDPRFSPQQGTFAVADAHHSLVNPSDRFQTLSQELKLMIVDRLDSQDIANLRLSSRAFRQLPLALFYRLIRREMPWLFEVWDPEPPLFWTALTEKDISAEEEKWQSTMSNKVHYYRDVIHDEMPELWNDWVAAEPEKEQLCLWRKRALEKVSKNHVSLPQEKIDWYQLYYGIRKHWNDLKGLQNRERIWKEVGDIVNQIAEYRDQGMISD